MLNHDKYAFTFSTITVKMCLHLILRICEKNTHQLINFSVHTSTAELNVIIELWII